MIRKPDDKELKYFQLFSSGRADNTRLKKIRSDAYFSEWKPAFSLNLGFTMTSYSSRSHTTE